MNRREFIGSIGSVATVSTMAMLTTTTSANAFVITLAAVAKVATIAASALSMFSSGSDPTTGLMYQTYLNVLDAHKKLDELEKLIIEILKKVDGLPEQLKLEIEQANERKTNLELIAIVNSFKEDMLVFEASLGDEGEDKAFERLKTKTLLHQTRLQILRNELKFYSGFSLISLAGAAVTEVAMHVVGGGKPEQLVHLRSFYSDLLTRHRDPTMAGSLASVVQNARDRYLSEQNKVTSHLAGFPFVAGKQAVLVDGGFYLDRCTVFGYPSEVWGKAGAAASTRSAGRTHLRLNDLYQRHETKGKRKKFLDHDKKYFEPTGTSNSRIQIHVDTFEAAGQALSWLRLPQRPEVIFSAGEKTAQNKKCSLKVIGRPNVIEKGYVAHVKSAHQSAIRHNQLSEAYGVVLQYQAEVEVAFSAMAAYLDQVGVPA
jgi:hypothetical protein